jgi:hypothetical protein
VMSIRELRRGAVGRGHQSLDLVVAAASPRGTWGGYLEAGFPAHQSPPRAHQKK